MKKIYSLAGGFFTLFFIALPLRTNAFPMRAPEVQIIDLETRIVQDHFFAFEKGYRGGLRVVAGDVDGDGKMEIIVAESGGLDARGRVRVFSSHHDLLAEWFAFPEEVMHQEMNLAVGDIDGDHKAEILVTRSDTTNSTIAIFDGEGKLDAETAGMITSFPEEHIGVTMTVGRFHNSSVMEIVAVPYGSVITRARFFDAMGSRVGEITPLGNDRRDPLTVTAADTDGDQRDELIFTHAENNEEAVIVVTTDSTPKQLGAFRVLSREWPSGVRVVGYDRDRNGTKELAFVPSADHRSALRVVRGDGATTGFEPLALFEEDFLGGADIAIAQMDHDPAAEVVVVPTQQKQRGDLSRGEQYIEVDLSEQKLFAWEGGYLRQAYLISSGLPGTPTPTGEFSILTKIERHLYDGPNYYFPNTPWNLRFYAGGVGKNMYFHTAYWHNNFGHPMSHGCVNMREADAKFLYFWADVGTPAWIHD